MKVISTDDGQHRKYINRAYWGVSEENENKLSVVVASFFGAYRFLLFMQNKDQSVSTKSLKNGAGGVYSAIAAPFTMPFDLVANFFHALVWLDASKDSAPGKLVPGLSALFFPNQAAVFMSRETEDSATWKRILTNALSGGLLGFLAYCPIHCLLSPETLPGFVKGMHWMPALNWLDTASVSLKSLAPIQVILQVTTVIALLTAIERVVSKEGGADVGDIARIVTAVGMCAVPILIPALCHLDISGMPTHIALALFFAMPIVNNVMQGIAGRAKGKAARTVKSGVFESSSDDENHFNAMIFSEAAARQKRVNIVGSGGEYASDDEEGLPTNEQTYFLPVVDTYEPVFNRGG